MSLKFLTVGIPFLWKRGIKRSKMDQQDSKRRAATDKNVPKINIINNDILCYILTFLPFKEAVRTSVLARSWRNLWKFNSNLIVECRDNVKIHNMRNSDTVISNILDSHRTKLQCCQICHSVSDLSQGRVLQWITRLRESHHVQDLTLKTFFKYEQLRNGAPVCDEQLSPPSKLLGSQTLQVLKLSQYVLRDGSAFEGCVNLSTLKLRCVKLFSSRTIAEIISNCPQLTNLSLTHCVEKLSPPSKLFGSRTLQVLELSYFVLRDGSAFEGCVNLTTLKLQDVKLFSSRTIAEIISNCPQLKNLSLTHCVESQLYIWKDLTLRSDKLEYLELCQNTRILNLHIDAVKLRSLVLEFQLSVGDTYINTPVLTSFRLLDKLGSRFLSYPLGHRTPLRFSFRHKGLENIHYLSVVLGLSYQSDDELLCRIFQVCLHLKELHIVNYHGRQDVGGHLPQENIRENDEPLLFWDDDKIEGKVAINLRALEVSMFRADRLEMEFVRYVMSYADQMELIVLRYDKSCSRQVIDAANKILLSHPRASGIAAIRLRLEQS